MMSMIDHGPDPTQTPIAVGAIGGSGTRVVGP
ncbi:sulfotransferase family protein, partial [Rhodobacter sphaeroides]|nr:sulfotransferase family protein [Cereibacter sphaeroides]